MGCNILVVNVGSTSFKFSMIDAACGQTLARGRFENVFSAESRYYYHGIPCGTMCTTAGYRPCIEKMFELLHGDAASGFSGGVRAVAFKAVMAGDVKEAEFVDDEIIAKLERYSFAAPAHNPPYIDAMREFERIMPETPRVAVFETGFHKTIPDYAYTYSINGEIAEKYGIRKWGFHGASHSCSAYAVGKLLPDCKRLISCHLGGSSSVCAIKDGKSIDISMGFSPQSGLPMNNRCGDIDVFAVLYLMKEMNLGADEARSLLSEKSGLYGMTGVSGDMRVLLNEASPRCKTAVNAYVYAIAKYIGSFAVALGGLDALSFSGGIGENSSKIREAVCIYLKPFGILLDGKLNEKESFLRPEVVSAEDSASKIVVVPADEELTVARKTAELIGVGVD